MPFLSILVSFHIHIPAGCSAQTHAKGLMLQKHSKRCLDLAILTHHLQRHLAVQLRVVR